MRSFRSKPVGWRGESYRHSLAARGYYTRKPRFIAPSPFDVIEASKLSDEGVKPKVWEFGEDELSAISKRSELVKQGNIAVMGSEDGKFVVEDYGVKGEMSPAEERAYALATGKIDYLARKGIKTKIPIDVAFEMRRKGSGLGEMEQKRTDEYMERLEKSMKEKGFTEPIPASEEEIAEGRLQEGKHRLIVAKKLGMKEVPVEIKWRDNVDIPIIDYPKSFGHDFEKKVVMMSPDEFLKKAGGETSGEHVEKMEGVLKEEKSFASPLLEVDASGKVITHDGRHRVMYAKRQGAKEVPVVMFQDKGKKE